AQEAPAERYAHVLWNHGSGWQPDDLDDLYDNVRRERGDVPRVSARELSVLSERQVGLSFFSTSAEGVMAEGTAGERAILSDDGTGHSLDTIELDRVLELAHGRLGGKLELLGMDACLMSTLEVAFEVRDHASHVVGSEELEPGDGWPYTRILRRLSDNPDMGGQDLGQAVVDCYIDHYRDLLDQHPVTQCALDTSSLDGFAASFDRLASELQNAIGTELGMARVVAAQSLSTMFTGDLFDIKSFCRNLLEGQSEQGVKEAAQQVLDSLQPGGLVVAEGHVGEAVEDCGGVTAYFPAPTSHMSPYYSDLEFSTKYSWDEFLQAYRPASRRGTASPHRQR
ncbi:MAG: clostripain-related cysteine peptidase, partial [Rubrobacter sp.]